MPTITKQQIQRIYALGSVAGLVEPGNKHDNLHAFVYQLTGKTSVREVDVSQFAGLEKALKANVKAVNPPVEPKAWISKEQIKKCFGLMYTIQKLSPSKATVKERLAGAMKKALDIDVDIGKDIFWGLSEEQGSTLIEMLKRYARSAERKAKK